MNTKKKVIAISGSTRATSTNLNYIKAIQELAADLFSLKIFNGLMNIPSFNPDDDTNPENVPASIKDFRNLLKEADGILICTPEYAMGVPGTLKNAIDWTVSSMEFSQKPVALITASLSGQKVHAALMETLVVIESIINDDTQLIIPFAKTKITVDYKITDDATLSQIKKLIASFSSLMNEQ